ncbi:MAG TPA: hypothetical protein VJQ59_17000 [Candidatus Sulfotelmatobacter sp.]|nr:hypothetical protein [Candidatus Sulfotelmatobacter sp.]
MDGELYEVLRKRANASGMSLEAYIDQQLRRFGSAPVDSFFIPHSTKREIETAVGMNLRDGSMLANAVKRLATLNVAELPVRLQMKTLERLKSRCINQPDFRLWLEQQIQVLCDQFVGLR